MPDPVDRQAPPSPEQRDRATKVLDAAYGDGQITLAEYEERSRGVREADNAWRLERWVDDLQVPPSLAPVPSDRRPLTVREYLATRPAARHRTGQGWWHDTRRSWRRAPRSIKVAICALLLVMTAPVAVAVVQEVTGVGTSVATSDRISSGLGEFRDAYEDEFDTTEISNLQINPEYAQFEVIVETDPPRSQAWTWQDGSFSEVGGLRGTRSGVIDLADIDVVAVDDALRAAVPELGVEEVSEVITVIRPAPGSDQVRLTLVVSNEFQETARLLLGPDGHEIGRQPLTEPGEE